MDQESCLDFLNTEQILKDQKKMGFKWGQQYLLCSWSLYVYQCSSKAFQLKHFLLTLLSKT